jgi:hypothetical protein
MVSAAVNGLPRVRRNGKSPGVVETHAPFLAGPWFREDFLSGRAGA